MPWVHTYPTDTFDDSDELIGATSAGVVKRYPKTEVAGLNMEDQVVAGGASVTAKQLTIPASPDVAITIDPGARPLQYVLNVGNFTIAAPTVDGSCMLLIVNGTASPDVTPGTVTFSGFTVSSNTGDTLTTTRNDKFTVSIWRINGVSGYSITAHQ